VADPWGAPFIKLFGFSFTAVRLSILPIAMAPNDIGLTRITPMQHGEE
jgi:hypothetical protein